MQSWYSCRLIAKQFERQCALEPPPVSYVRYRAERRDFTPPPAEIDLDGVSRRSSSFQL